MPVAIDCQCLNGGRQCMGEGCPIASEGGGSWGWLNCSEINKKNLKSLGQSRY